MPVKPRTLGDWLHHAEKLYARKKIALGQVAISAHDEALYLLLHTLGLPLDSRPGVLRRKLAPDEVLRVEQRAYAHPWSQAGGLSHPRGVAG